MERERLEGGNSNDVFRDGDTVLRSAGPWTPTIHRLLRHLRDGGLDWVPQAHGVTPEGQEIVTFIEGDVPAYPMPAWIWHDAVLVDAARKLRQLHDATVGYRDPDAHWRLDAHEPAEVICHNDFAPYNMVFVDERCVGVIDFDMASPGPRLWDLAYLAYRIVPLTDPENPDGADFDESTCRARLARLIDAYGIPYPPHDVLEMTIARLDDLARFSDRMAEEKANPDLHEHAALYRKDATWIRGLMSCPKERHASTTHREPERRICDS